MSRADSLKPYPKLVAQSIEVMAKAIGGTITHVNASPAVKSYLSTIGTKGGKAKSDAKTISSQRNAKLGGRPMVNPSAEDIDIACIWLENCQESAEDDARSAAVGRVIRYLERKAAKRAAGKSI